MATASGAEALSKEDTCSLAYVLQAGDLAARRALVVSQLADSKRDVLILDRNYSGNDKPWSVAEVQTIRQAQPARRVIAYLSIGEAEDYREYWQKNWSVSDDGKRSKATPSFVVAPNPNWPGNYKVRYWDKRWQALVFKQLQEIVAAEFDGIYLDIIDAFELFEYDARH